MNGWPKTNHNLIRRATNPRDETAWRELQAIHRPVILILAPYPFFPVVISGALS